jgi:hypothetical protein
LARQDFETRGDLAILHEGLAQLYRAAAESFTAQGRHEDALEADQRAEVARERARRYWLALSSERRESALAHQR